MKAILNFSVLLFCLAFNALAQTDKTTTAKIVAEKNFVFVATAANPLNVNDINNILRQMPGNMNGGSISLTDSNYDVVITSDSLVAFLPYYGRAFSAPMTTEENGYKFKSKDFSYTSTQRKKGGWEISINTKDVKNSPKLNLSINENGYATLTIISNNKQSINYNGFLAENKKKQ